jgi:hypothetical protein
MFCPKCGKELPDDANFCMKCGRALHSDVKSVQEADRWETCEIKWRSIKAHGLFGGGAKVVFFGEAIGPKGQYNAGESPVFPGWGGYYSNLDSEDANGALNALVKKLSQDGWEYVGIYDNDVSYARKFRRRVRSS